MEGLEINEEGRHDLPRVRACQKCAICPKDREPGNRDPQKKLQKKMKDIFINHLHLTAGMSTTRDLAKYYG